MHGKPDTSDPKTRQNKKSSSFPTWGKVIIGILLFILLVLAAVCLAVNLSLNRIQRVSEADSSDFYTEEEYQQLELQEAVEEAAAAGTEEETDQEVNVTYPELDPETIVWTEPSEQIAESASVTNILLIGQDARSGESRARSDSMILVSINQTDKTITMTSFLRDLYVQIPGYQNSRLNAAYAYGGMELLDETLNANFGVDIDANIEVRFEDFTQIIDMLDGVDIELTDAEADYLGLSAAGMTHMDGDLALAYSRIRYIDSDFYRTGRQRKVLTSLYDDFKNTSLTDMISIINQILPLLTTDMTNSQIISLATATVPMLSGSTLNSITIPADGTWSYNTVNQMSVIVADFESNRKILADNLE